MSGIVKSTRRRGTALERALLEAAWNELTEKGFGNFTMEGVAERAGTSRAVLYRRWPDRGELAIAAIKFYGDENQVTPPDTGTLRGDLIGYLQEASDKRIVLAALFMLGMAEFYRIESTTPADLRSRMLKDRSIGVDAIFDRAIARGEIDGSRLTPRLKALAFDLIRAEMTMTLRPVPTEVITEIVDQIVLPLVSARS